MIDGVARVTRWAVVGGALVVPVATALAFLAALRRRGRLATGPALELPLAVALGFGLALATCTAWLALPTTRIAALALPEIALLVAAVAWWARSPLPPPPGPRAEPAEEVWRRAVLGVALVLAAGAAAWVFVATVRRAGFGHWDAWAMWNSRARFFALAPDGWRAAFEVSGVVHPDYPFLLPAAIARLWTYSGRLGFLEPVTVAGMFALASAGTLFAGLLRLRGFASAALATTFLLGATSLFHGLDSFPQLAALQLADVPVGCFYLVALVLTASAPERGGARPGHLALAGVALSLAAWTKNEGAAFGFVLFVALALVGAIERGGASKRDSLALFVGALPGWTAWVAFKLLLAPPGDLVSPGNTGLWAKLTDPERHRIVASILLENAVRFGAGAFFVVLAVALLLGLRRSGRRPAAALPALVVAAALAVDYLVLVLTPHDPTWHATSAWSRLLAQLWPSYLFALFLLARAPGEDAGAAAPALTASPNLR